MGAADPLTDDQRSRALARLFELHADFVWRSLCRMGLAGDQAEDATQDVFLVAHQKLDALRSVDEARPWLFAIARRVASTHRRSQTRAKKREAKARLRAVPEDPEEALRRQRAAERMQVFLDGLEEKHLLPFVLYELEGLSGREIAEATGWKLNTVFTRLKAARRRFESYAREVNQ